MRHAFLGTRNKPARGRKYKCLMQAVSPLGWSTSCFTYAVTGSALKPAPPTSKEVSISAEYCLASALRIRLSRLQTARFRDDRHE